MENFNDYDTEQLKYQIMSFDSYDYYITSGIIPKMRPSTESAIKNFFDNYNIELIIITDIKFIQHQGWYYEMSPVNEVDMNFYLPLLTLELSLYPSTFLSKLKMRQIIVCHSINFHYNDIEQYRPGLADTSSEIMGMVYSAKERDIDTIRSVIHHELFHYFEYLTYGCFQQNDYEWNLFNPKDFVYGNNTANYNNYHSDYFVTQFSKNSIEEDRAEMFAWMVTKGDILQNLQKREGVFGKALIIRKRLEYFDPIGFRTGQKDFWEKARCFLFVIIMKYFN